jgi:eukaryotic-like serine/threonine-protein kinase
MENIIKFIRQKDYKLIKELKCGATGHPILIEDETIGEQFVCKKYSPDDQNKERFYNNFKDEIKILHKVYNKNIVRVFNYYLYPEQKTGYILMEYIKGENIDVYLKNNPSKINEIFLQAIDGFCYLEEKNILHRDIRPNNILISDDTILKIIDFGFSKFTELGKTEFNSIPDLNWICSVPEELSQNRYDHRTEIYFIGRLFANILNLNNIQGFKYNNIITKMIEVNYNDRIDSFPSIKKLILDGEMETTIFSTSDKKTYQNFADSITSILTKIDYNSKYKFDIESIISNLEEINNNSNLEDLVYNSSSIISCFITGSFEVNKKVKMSVETLRSFLHFFRKISFDKQQVVLNNIGRRLDSIERDVIFDLPF